MYVTPFWTFETAGADVLVTNTITNRRVTITTEALGVLAELHENPALAPAGESLGALERAGIVFADHGSAERWLDEQLPTAGDLGPSVDQIELTNRCPYTCQMCPRTTSMTRDLGSMPIPLFTAVIEQIAPYQDYTALHHFGESLLHPEIDVAVRVALERGVRTGLSCNPPTLTPALSRRLLDAGLANMVLSLDSLDAETYRGIRGHAARLDKADQHVQELVRTRDQGGYSTWITLQMIAMRVNQEEIDRFLEYCAEKGVDRGIVVRLGRWDFTDEYLATLGEHDSPGYTPPCHLPKTSVVVLWDGRVVPCCHDYDGDVVLGDLKRQRLTDVWASPAARRFRNHNQDYELCRQCAFSRWYKEEQRKRDGFLRFHRKVETATSTRYEWTNPASLSRNDGGALFDRFDVYTRDL
jgi:radical SAM protein with 4Fe4S-binding SPASM domain